MLKAVGFAFLFMLVVLGAFLWIGHSVTNMVGGGKKVVSAVEITPEGGETIFWGKGRCFTCHSVGVRGPNQGVFGEKFQEPIGLRAVTRARERSEETGEEYSATDYLIESLAVPGAYVVNGYKNEMAIVYAPPIALNLKEVKAVITYLQSQGGEPDIEALNNPSEISGRYIARIQAASAAGGGDPGAGAIVFEDNCMECHMIKGEGEEIGPDLSAISSEGLKFISESIIEPSKHIEEGFETYEVIDLEGRKTTGLKTRDDAEEVDITKATGEVVTIAKSDIKEINTGDLPSIMPNDLIEALTVKDYQDVLSYLIMQKGE